MHWELWDTESGNLVGDYPTEAAALTIVRDALRRHGPAIAVTLDLGAQYDDESVTDDDLPPVLSGGDLIARAEYDAADSL